MRPHLQVKILQEKARREDIVVQQISSTRRQLGFNPLSEQQLDSWVTDWLKVLAVVPTERIEECFTLAMQHHRDGPFAVCEVIMAWTEIKAELDRKAIQEKPIITDAKELIRCQQCFGSGWIRIERIVDARKITGVKRCNCESDKVVDLSPGLPMPEDFKRAKREFIRNHSFNALKHIELDEDEDS